MDSYEINRDTVALIPKDNDKTVVYETDKSFVVNETPIKIMENSCEFFGSSLEGRQKATTKIIGVTHKVPVIVSETFNLIFFPSSSPRNNDCIWLSYSHIFKPSKFNNHTLLELVSGKKIILNVSTGIIDNQLYRASRLKYILQIRKK
jgi:competence protein ComK